MTRPSSSTLIGHLITGKPGLFFGSRDCKAQTVWPHAGSAGLGRVCLQQEQWDVYGFELGQSQGGIPHNPYTGRVTTLFSPVVSSLLCGARNFLQQCLVGVLCRKEDGAEEALYPEGALSIPSFPSSRTKLGLGLTILPPDPGRLVIMLPSPVLALSFFLSLIVSLLSVSCHPWLHYVI